MRYEKLGIKNIKQRWGGYSCLLLVILGFGLEYYYYQTPQEKVAFRFLWDYKKGDEESAKQYVTENFLDALKRTIDFMSRQLLPNADESTEA